VHLFLHGTRIKNVFAVEIGLLADCGSCAPFPSGKRKKEKKRVLVVPLLHHLERRQFHSNEEVEVVLGEWLRFTRIQLQQQRSFNSCQCGKHASMCLEIILKNN